MDMAQKLETNGTVDGIPMRPSNRWAVVALFMPIFILASLVFWHQTRLMQGKTVTLAITGMDPRDILAGNYLSYGVVFPNVTPCPSSNSATDNAVICLDPPNFEYGIRPSLARCDLFIRGKCNAGQFQTDLNRFYIPAEYGIELEHSIQTGDGSIKVVVSTDGHAVVDDLLMNGKPWKQYIEEQHEKSRSSQK